MKEMLFALAVLALTERTAFAQTSLSEIFQ